MQTKATNFIGSYHCLCYFFYSSIDVVDFEPLKTAANKGTINKMFEEALVEYSAKGGLGFEPFIERFYRPLDSDLAAYSSSLVIDFIERQQIGGLQPKFRWWAAFTYSALNSGNQVFIDKALSLRVDMQVAVQSSLSNQSDDIRRDGGALKTSQALSAINLYLYKGWFDCLWEVLEDYFDWVIMQDDQFLCGVFIRLPSLSKNDGLGGYIFTALWYFKSV